MKFKAGKPYLVIPITLSKFVAEHRFYTPFQVYLFLKAYTPGKAKLSRKDLFYIAEALGFKTEKTIKTNLKKLQNKNWIGYNAKSGVYFFRSIENVMKIETICGRTSTLIFTNQIKYSKSFVIASVLKYSTRTLRRYLSRKAALNNKQSANQSSKKSTTPGFIPISISLMAKKLNVSKTNALKLKRKAIKEDMLEAIPQTSVLSDNAKHLTYIRKGLHEDAQRIIRRNGNVILVESDLIKINVSFRRRSKRKEKK